ncbi:hypothetical protein MTR67_001000 [Solanum verrucosum]|uniref:Reverse transcriptase domain-containing protein n=1 Tax=Solanum verrucosum TaxID=315347 RepID=A0AAF0TBZ9_SOLVR|nr:hypothetical protein MTR67_001000 [Solanum verrucosum]
MRWFQNGDMNTKFFHAHVNERRRKLQISEIKTKQGDTVTTTQNIGEEAVSVFKEQFMETNEPTDYSMLDSIPKMITEEQKEEMRALPFEEEVKEVVFALNGDSAIGLDGFSELFFQSCWDTVKSDIVNMVKAFFCGHELPRFITHTNLVLIPKNEEIIRDINRRNKLHNVVVKLDMAKAYDIVFLTKDLRGFGFSKRIIDMVVMLISNNWYSVIINGQNFGFFRSSRGLKQGDPLSPTLFIIAAEVLARSLNQLFKDQKYKGFGLPKWSPVINHLSYADDTILFCSGQSYSMRKMMKVLRDYEQVSGQLINLNKSFTYLHEKVPIGVCRKVRRITRIKQGSFSFTYLGCPIFYGKKNRTHFESLIKKVVKRISSWQNILLNFGGRYVLIAHVLQCMPIYVLSAMNPPACVITQLHRISAKKNWLTLQGLRTNIGWLGTKCAIQEGNEE